MSESTLIVCRTLGLVGHRRQVVLESVRAAYEQGYREGQERMKEQAMDEVGGPAEDTHERIARLPIEPAPEGKP